MWQVDGLPLSKLDVGQVFDVRGSVAIYLRAMGCAEMLGLPARRHRQAYLFAFAGVALSLTALRFR
jgi:hypothetical protein